MNFEAMKYILPVSPRICLYFFGLERDRKFQRNKNLFPYYFQNDTVDGYNRAIINVANYWVIAQDEFNIFDIYYIKNRKNKDY